MLDVCCSYGTNAALLNYDLELDDLNDHYRSVDPDLDPSRLTAFDRRWFASRCRLDAVPVIGLDVADNALRYATSVGLLDRSVQADLEADPCDSEAREDMATADLVTVTGGIGCVGEKTFGAIVEASGHDPRTTRSPKARPPRTWTSCAGLPPSARTPLLCGGG